MATILDFGFWVLDSRSGGHARPSDRARFQSKIENPKSKMLMRAG
jgi:hypothetical protein